MDVLPFVPPDFEPPAGLATREFVLEPLGPRTTRHPRANL